MDFNPFGKRVASSVVAPNVDKYSIAFFRSKDLNRNKFGYDTMCKIGLWLDELVQFLEMFQLSYSKFIVPYGSSDEFDEPLRESTIFMLQMPYRQDPSIVDFVKCKDHDIPAKYISVMIAEDNCYMYELESRNRSANEKKHYHLATALSALLEYENISIGAFKMTDDNKKKLFKYMIIYNLRRIYATIDDVFRKLIHSVIEKEAVDINLDYLLRGTIKDMDETVLKHFHVVDDDILFGHVCICRDLLTYLLLRVTQFKSVFGLPQLDELALPRSVRYTYEYYSNMLSMHERKGDLMKSDRNPTSVMKESEKIIDMITPRYFREKAKSPTVSTPRPSTPRTPRPSTPRSSDSSERVHDDMATFIVSYVPSYVIGISSGTVSDVVEQDKKKHRRKSTEIAITRNSMLKKSAAVDQDSPRADEPVNTDDQLAHI